MRLKITSFGQSAEGIELTGNPKSCEPVHVRISFPGGDVEVVRAVDGDNPDYWVHVRVNHPDGAMVALDDLMAQMSDARIDRTDKHSADVDVGEFGHPNVNHIAFRVKPHWPKKTTKNKRK
jgi:hypothetical protein